MAALALALAAGVMALLELAGATALALLKSLAKMEALMARWAPVDPAGLWVQTVMLELRMVRRISNTRMDEARGCHG